MVTKQCLVEFETQFQASVRNKTPTVVPSVCYVNPIVAERMFRPKEHPFQQLPSCSASSDSSANFATAGLLSPAWVSCRFNSPENLGQPDRPLAATGWGGRGWRSSQRPSLHWASASNRRAGAAAGDTAPRAEFASRVTLDTAGCTATVGWCTTNDARFQFDLRHARARADPVLRTVFCSRQTASLVVYWSRSLRPSPAPNQSVRHKWPTVRSSRFRRGQRHPFCTFVVHHS